MTMQVELLKAELDRVREERDRLRDTLETVRATARGVLRWPEVRGSKRIREVFKSTLDQVAEELDALDSTDPDPCTHREGDGICSQCSSGEGS